MMILYNAILLGLYILSVPFLYARGKWHDQFKLRFSGPQESWSDPGEKTIWIHAVSVGEILAIVDLVEKLKQDYSGYQCVCSTVTKTGFALALEKFKGNAKIVYAPLDFSWTVKRYISSIKPSIYISTETEIWPNLFLQLKQAGVPIVIVNGRISERSFGRYKMARPFLKKTLDCVTVFCMQSEADARRIIELGADCTRVKSIGNVKFDAFVQTPDITRQGVGLKENDLIFIGGSTHPGEETILIEIYKDIYERFQQLKLILCPRHIERVCEVFELVKRSHLAPARFSDRAKDLQNNVLIVDSIGQLRSLYGIADLVFVGKTLAVGGGQNMIEPAALGKPVIVGPLTENFKDAMRIFLQDQAIIQVQDKEELKSKVIEMLKNDQSRHEIGSRAKWAVEKHQGATQRTLAALKKVLMP